MALGIIVRRGGRAGKLQSQLNRIQRRSDRQSRHDSGIAPGHATRHRSQVPRRQRFVGCAGPSLRRTAQYGRANPKEVIFTGRRPLHGSAPAATYAWSAAPPEGDHVAGAQPGTGSSDIFLHLLSSPRYILPTTVIKSSAMASDQCEVSNHAVTYYWHVW